MRSVQGGPALPVYMVGSDSEDALPVSGTMTTNQGDAGDEAWPIAQRPQDAAAADNQIPASNTAAAIVYAAAQGSRHVISGVAWSYSGAPTPSPGALSITGSVTGAVFSIQIPGAGPGFIPFNPPRRFANNESVTISLAAGGTGIAGRVNALGHWTEPT